MILFLDWSFSHRERERDRQTDRQIVRQREREREREIGCILYEK